MTEVLVTALYEFVPLTDLHTWQAELRGLCEARDIRGTLLIASEGINGTIAGQPANVREFLSILRSRDPFKTISHKESLAQSQPFKRLKVKIKREIVTMGVPDLDIELRGEYVEPQDWNALISDPDVVVIDARNDYETEIGQFRGAVDPVTKHFRQLPEWLDNHEALKPTTRVAMYCTGGIRCEKSTAYLRAKGIKEVFHLHGGILKYLEEIPEKDSLWQGECFVFDDRVAVNHQLEPGGYEMCFGCRRPLHPQDKASPKFREGVSCPRCFDDLSESQKERFAMRQAQHERAKSEAHAGSNDSSSDSPGSDSLSDDATTT